MPAILLTADDHYSVVDANGDFLQLTAKKHDKLCGRSLLDVFPDQEPANPHSATKITIKCLRDTVSYGKPQSPGRLAYAFTDDVTGKTRLRHLMPEFIPVADESGTISYVFLLIREVAEEPAKYIEQESSPDFSFEDFLKTAQNAFFLTNMDGAVLQANETASKLFGYTVVELKTLTRAQLVDYTDQQLSAFLLDRDRAGRSKGEVTGIRKNGERFPCEYSSVAFSDHKGNKYSCTEIIDISHWKQAEAKIRQSELNMRAIFNHTVEGFVLLDTDFRIMACNDKAADFVFLDTEHIVPQIGHSVFDYIDEERKAFFKQVTTRVLAGERMEYEISYRRKDGKLYWYAFSVGPVQEGDQVTGLCLTGRDITSQKLADEKVLHSEKRFRGLVENNASAIAILTADFRVVYISPAGEKITGYTETELKALDDAWNFHEGELPTALNIMNEVIASPGKSIKSPPVRLQHKNGSWRWVEATLTNMLHDPAIGGIINNFWDVTERIEFQERLLEAKRVAEQSEAGYRRLFNQSPLPKWLYDLETLRFLEVNDEAVRHYGYTREEFLGMTILDIRPPEDAALVKQMIQGVPKSQLGDFTYWRHFKKNGEAIMVDIVGHRMEYNGRTVGMVVCRDVTERLRYIEAIEEQNKQLREIAWFQSHITRAPLARIMGLTGLLATDPSETSLREILPLLQKSADELDEIIKGIVEKTKTLYTDLS